MATLTNPPSNTLPMTNFNSHPAFQDPNPNLGLLAVYRTPLHGVRVRVRVLVGGGVGVGDA